MADQQWDSEGNAANIEAAADDAILWLNLLANSADRLNMPKADRENLRECRNALAKFCGSPTVSHLIDSVETISRMYSHDEKALEVAREILNSKAVNYTQHMAMAQVAVLDAMRWAAAPDHIGDTTNMVPSGAKATLRCAECDLPNGCPEYCLCTPAASPSAHQPQTSALDRKDALLRQAKDWFRSHGEAVFAGGGMGPIDAMNPIVAAIDAELSNAPKEPK